MSLRCGRPRFAAAALILSLGGTASARSTEDFGPLRRALRRSSMEAPERSEVVARLTALGPEAVPGLYELVTGHGLEELIGDEWVPESWVCLPEEIPVLCAKALEHAPVEAFCGALERALDNEPTFQDRLVMLRLLGARGSGDGLPLLFRGAKELGDLELQRPSVQLALRESLVSILRRDNGSWRTVAKALADLEPATIEVLVDAIGEAGRSRGMNLLERLFRTGSVDPARLALAMERLERAIPWDLGGRTMHQISFWFYSQEPQARALAARLAGSLHSLDSVPELIQLSGESDQLVRRCALDALQSIAGLPLDPDPKTLESWYEQEEAWYAARYDDLLAQVREQPNGQAVEALGELARHPLYRDEIAAELAASLPMLEPEKGLAVIAELERCASRRALPGLIATLEEGPAPVREAAWRVLCGITGESRERSLDFWRLLIDA